MAINGDATYFKQMLLESAQRQSWRLASQHSGHCDIVVGGELAPARKLMKNLTKRELWQDIGMTVCTAANGIWTKDRLYKAGMIDDDQCPRCCAAAETAYHRYWECPANCQVENQLAIETSEYMRGKSSRDSAQLTRGIPPLTAYPKIPPTRGW